MRWLSKIIYKYFKLENQFLGICTKFAKLSTDSGCHSQKDSN